jgi:hypothetical protein
MVGKRMSKHHSPEEDPGSDIYREPALLSWLERLAAKRGWTVVICVWLLLSTALNSIGILVERSLYWPNFEYDLRGAGDLGGLLTMLVLFLGLYAFVTMFTSDRPRQNWIHLGFVGSYIFIGALCEQSVREARTQGMHDLADRLAPLVEAIKSYEEAEGGAPPSLGALMPEYIANIPQTQIEAYPDLLYSKGMSGKGDNPWMLTVPTPLGGFNWDEFLYLPNGDYPKYNYGGGLERIGDWAYVHE